MQLCGGFLFFLTATAHRFTDRFDKLVLQVDIVKHFCGYMQLLGESVQP